MQLRRKTSANISKFLRPVLSCQAMFPGFFLPIKLFQKEEKKDNPIKELPMTGIEPAPNCLE